MGQNVTICPSKTAHSHTNISIHGRFRQCKWSTFLLMSNLEDDNRYIVDLCNVLVITNMGIQRRCHEVDTGRAGGEKFRENVYLGYKYGAPTS